MRCHYWRRVLTRLVMGIDWERGGLEHYCWVHGRVCSSLHAMWTISACDRRAGGFVLRRARKRRSLWWQGRKGFEIRIKLYRKCNYIETVNWLCFIINMRKGMTEKESVDWFCERGCEFEVGFVNMQSFMIFNQRKWSLDGCRRL